MERGLSLVAEHGSIMFIVPNSWLNNLFLKDVRRFLLNESAIESICSMPTAVFEEASVDTAIVKISKKQNIGYTEIIGFSEDGFSILSKVEQKTFLDDEDCLINTRIDVKVQNILRKVESAGNFLEDFTSIARGVGVYHKRVGHSPEFIKEDPYQSNIRNNDTFVPYLRGKTISPYKINWNNNSFISYGKWLAEPREPKYFEGDRIVLRQIPGNKLIAAFISDKFVADQSVFIAKFDKSDKISPLYILGVLCSKLMYFYFQNKYSEFDELFPKLKLQHFKRLPFKIDSPLSNKIKGLVSEIILLKEKDINADTNQYESEIDKLVYGMFELTEEEIGIVQQSLK